MRTYRIAARRVVEQLIAENRQLRQRTGGGPTALAAFFSWLESRQRAAFWEQKYQLQRGQLTRLEEDNLELRRRLLTGEFS